MKTICFDNNRLSECGLNDGKNTRKKCEQMEKAILNRHTSSVLMNLVRDRP